MRNYIEGNGLIDFINGKIKPPKKTRYVELEEIENPEYKQWKQIDDELRSSIISTIEKGLWEELSCSFTGKSAAELWDFIVQNVHRTPAMTHADRGT